MHIILISFLKRVVSVNDGLFLADVCVCCGCALPEGEMICSVCKKQIIEQSDILHNQYSNT